MRALVNIYNPLYDGSYFIYSDKSELEDGSISLFESYLKQAIKVSYDMFGHANASDIASVLDTKFNFKNLSRYDWNEYKSDLEKYDFDCQIDVGIQCNNGTYNLMITSIHNELISKSKMHIDCKSNEGSNIGNYVDLFLYKKVYPKIVIVMNLYDNVKNRKDIREKSVEYCQTACYENDFTEISKIKDIAKQIVDDCNKQLEVMADKYTKIN